MSHVLNGPDCTCPNDEYHDSHCAETGPVTFQELHAEYLREIASKVEAERREHTANCAVDALLAEVKQLRATVGSNPDLFKRFDVQVATIRDLQAEVERLRALARPKAG